jgi:hypothetical protein
MSVNITELLINQLVDEVTSGYTATFGSLHRDYCEILEWTATMVMEIISRTDALYHNMEHTLFVTLVGQEMLRGKHIKEGGITPDIWLNSMISFMCHDIGYIKGVCLDDDIKNNKYAIGVGERICFDDGASTDAILTPYHVNRGKLFIAERFKNVAFVDVETVQRNIEFTRFPVPDTDDQMYNPLDPIPFIVRAADLVGQLADPRYLQKIPALFYEFEETGTNSKLGYKTPYDLKKIYPKFYWEKVHKFVKECLVYLGHTRKGRQYASQLYAHVFVVEHEE